MQATPGSQRDASMLPLPSAIAISLHGYEARAVAQHRQQRLNVRPPLRAAWERRDQGACLQRTWACARVCVCVDGLRAFACLPACAERQARTWLLLSLPTNLAARPWATVPPAPPAALAALPYAFIACSTLYACAPVLFLVPKVSMFCFGNDNTSARMRLACARQRACMRTHARMLLWPLQARVGPASHPGTWPGAAAEANSTTTTNKHKN